MCIYIYTYIYIYIYIYIWTADYSMASTYCMVSAHGPFGSQERRVGHAQASYGVDSVWGDRKGRLKHSCRVGRPHQ